MKRSPPAAGFSLLEVLLVVALVGIMAAAIIPNAAANPYESLTSAGQMLAADLAYARSLAVVNNDRYQLQFDRSNNLYKLVYSGTNPALTAIPPSPFQSPEDSAGSYVVRLGNLPSQLPSRLIQSLKNNAASAACAVGPRLVNR